MPPTLLILKLVYTCSKFLFCDCQLPHQTLWQRKCKWYLFKKFPPEFDWIYFQKLEAYWTCFMNLFDVIMKSGTINENFPNIQRSDFFLRNWKSQFMSCIFESIVNFVWQDAYLADIYISGKVIIKTLELIAQQLEKISNMPRTNQCYAYFFCCLI